MALLSREELRALAAADHDPCVSLYLPTHRGGKEIQQDPIRLKTLLRRADEQLSESGLEEPERDALLAPARRLLDDAFFWRHQSDGLALFLAGTEDLRRYRLPLSFPELAIVGSRFHLKPLLQVLSGEGRFYLLALSQKRVRLWEATAHSLREVDLAAIPESLADVVGYDWEERSLQFYTAAPVAGGGGVREGIFHGQGGATEDAKAEIATFLHRVDSGLNELLTDRRPPLVLAAADPVLGLFRALTKYPNVVDAAVEGNPDDVSGDVLRDRAWPLVEPLLLATEARSSERFAQLLGTGLASETPEVVLRGAADGRVDTLFVDLEAHLWGRFDPVSREVTRGRPDNGSEDLLDRAAVETLTHDGTLFVVPSRRLPGSEPLAAIFRY